MGALKNQTEGKRGRREWRKFEEKLPQNLKMGLVGKFAKKMKIYFQTKVKTLQLTISITFC